MEMMHLAFRVGDAQRGHLQSLAIEFNRRPGMIVQGLIRAYLEDDSIRKAFHTADPTEIIGASSRTANARVLAPMALEFERLMRMHLGWNVACGLRRLLEMAHAPQGRRAFQAYIKDPYPRVITHSGGDVAPFPSLGRVDDLAASAVPFISALRNNRNNRNKA